MDNVLRIVHPLNEDVKSALMCTSGPSKEVGTISRRLSSYLCGVVLLGWAVAPGCVNWPGGGVPTETPRPSPAATAGCTSDEWMPSSAGGYETQGEPVSAGLWVLILTGSLQDVVAGRSIKIIVKMTGSGALVIGATLGSAQLTPETAPQRHTGSNWDRPGPEWGTSWVFPTSGCWKVQASTGSHHADVWLKVL